VGEQGLICYAANFEDVILQRVFASVSRGCYLDVGAASPVLDSNTYALYQKGWRGVAIEPLPYRQMWEQARPEDLFLNVAVGEKAGNLTLHIYDRAQQVSSGDLDVVGHWQRHGMKPSRRIDVPVVTLDQVIAEHLPGRELHLLCIDVEGMERQVLNGLSLNVHRPWVVVLEATVPGTRTPAHEAWQSALLDAGYSMSYFDGLNQFYLAEERKDLRGAFALPPNIWDEFVMAKQIEMQEEIARLKRQIKQLQGN
jgi:FkbM family methyltransferase